MDFELDKLEVMIGHRSPLRVVAPSLRYMMQKLY
jgi:hypothetical protein